MQLVYISSGFIVAGLIRYYLSKIIYKKSKNKIKFWSMLINIVVCFLIGLIMALIVENNLEPLLAKNINNMLISAFIAFTVFSFRAVQYLKNKMFIKASTNIFYNLFSGLFFLTIGNLIGKSI